MENDFGKGNLFIRTQTLKDKASKLQLSLIEKQKVAVEKSQNMNLDSISRNSWENNAKEIGNIINCYEEIITSEVKSESDLKALEWFFNDGKLRTDEEISAIEQANAERDKEVAANVHAMQVELDEKVQAMRARVDFFHGKGFILIPVWTAVLELLFFGITSLFGFTYSGDDFAILFIPALIPGAATYLIFTVIHKCIVDNKIRKLYEEGGAKKPIDWSIPVEAGAIAYMLFGGKKK